MMCSTVLYSILKTKARASVALAVLLVLTSFASLADGVSRSTGLRQQVYEKMQEIQTLIEAKQLTEAQAALSKMQQGRLSDYELAQSWFLTGYAYYRDEKYQQALTAYEKVLVSENVPDGMKQNVLHTLSQIAMVLEEYTRALSYIDTLLSMAKTPVPDHLFLKAQILFQSERFEDSMQALESALSLQQQKALKLKENWLLLKNALLYRDNDYSGMLGVLHQLLALYPSDRYLINLAAIHGQLGNTEEQLALMEALYEKGSLATSSQLTNLANLYLMLEIPHKGAVLLEREINDKTIAADKQHLELLAQAWLLALEPINAIPPLQAVAKLTDNGEANLYLANTYISLQRWQDAESSLVTALEKGGLRNTGSTYMMLGMARFNQKRFSSARSAFARAGRYPKSESLSRQWLEYLAREQEKHAVLNDG